MAERVLVLGATGRFGRHACAAFRAVNWDVATFDRSKDTLITAAKGADVIVNGWNPPYSQWAAELPGLTQQVIAAAEASGATLIQPANVYVFGYGHAMPRVVGPTVPHKPDFDLARIRIEMEEALKACDAHAVVLRAGDFLDDRASAGWFDRVIAKHAKDKGRLSYPGKLDQPHAWAYLPDLAQALVGVATRRAQLGGFTDLGFAGYTLTAQELATACSMALGRDVVAEQMSWLPVQIARPFWAEAPHLLELRYLWNQPHRIDGSALEALVPGLAHTPVEEALRGSLNF